MDVVLYIKELGVRHLWFAGGPLNFHPNGSPIRAWSRNKLKITIPNDFICAFDTSNNAIVDKLFSFSRSVKSCWHTHVWAHTLSCRNRRIFVTHKSQSVLRSTSFEFGSKNFFFLLFFFRNVAVTNERWNSERARERA